MRITTKTVASAALITALAVGAAMPAAFAQDATEQSSDDSSATTPEERHAQARDEFAAALADELGLEVERVSAAIEEVETAMADERRAQHLQALEERLDAAVADGSLTREQADAILEAQEPGALGGFGGRGHHRGFGSHGGARFVPPAANSSAGTDAGEARETSVSRRRAHAHHGRPAANAASDIPVQGSGLGLAIVAGIVQAHGGRASVDSVVGFGTVVRLMLPLAGAVSSDG